MFRRVALLWRVVRERQDAGAFANMIPVVNASPPLRLTRMRQSIAASRPWQAEFQLWFRITHVAALPSICAHGFAQIGFRGALCSDFRMARVARLRSAERGTVSASLNASVADNDLCDRR